jgi:hypothetical protein
MNYTHEFLLQKNVRFQAIFPKNSTIYHSLITTSFENITVSFFAIRRHVKRAPMKTRVGKIARLPKIIREQINEKIENGMNGNHVLTWLNALPEVQKILAEQFGGCPISKQNLSEWRHGGYVDWARSRDGRNHWWEMMETARKLHDARSPGEHIDVSGYLGTFLIVELAEALDELHDMKDSTERRRLMSTISRVLSNVRTDDSREKRLHLKYCQQAAKNGQIAGSPTQSNLQEKILQT